MDRRYTGPVCECGDPWCAGCDDMTVSAETLAEMDYRLCQQCAAPLQTFEYELCTACADEAHAQGLAEAAEQSRKLCLICGSDLAGSPSSNGRHHACDDDLQRAGL